MENVKIIYQYDGSQFYGFQRQNNKKTVQGMIETIIYERFGEKINMISSGRTDKGVHAKYQVSNFFINKKISLHAIKNQINKHSNGQVIVNSIGVEEKLFNARFAAKKRTYQYKMKRKDLVTPFDYNYVTSIKNELNIEKMQQILNQFLGKHDFSSFMKKDKVTKNTNREIYSINIVYDSLLEEYSIFIEGNAFLKTMVRIMVGSSLAVYDEIVGENYILEKLDNPNVNCKKILAPSNGLYLYNVEY